jgi:chemotaxis protein CheX
MKVEFLNPFISGTLNVFRTMLNCELTRGEPGLKRNHAPEYEVSGLIGLSGKAHGIVVVSLGRTTALRLTETLLGQAPPDLNADVVDAVGELANMIAGSAKAQLEEYDLSVSLPSVICGKNHTLGYPSRATPIMIPFTSELGPVCIDVALEEVLRA